MARETRRPPFSGPAFTRLLAALNDAPASASTDAFAQRLSGWFDWTDAISLSAALNSPPTHVPGIGVTGAAHLDEREFVRVRATLSKLAAQASATTVETAAKARPARHATVRITAAPIAPDEFPPYRERHVAFQQAMETAIAALRRRVRATLAGASPELARLADLDAVLEQVVGEQERVLLSSLPGRLEQRFEHLRRAHAGHADASEPSSEHSPDEAARERTAWTDTFRREMHDVLLAELELRLQPVEGLLEALRASLPVSP